MKPSVVALFVDEQGAYAHDDRFDAWGISRDARSYDGEWGGCRDVRQEGR